VSAIWVFGYGSLIWRPAFDFLERRKARISGFVRRLFQGSDDHRGVPGALGRVATLIPTLEGEVVGVAYRLGPDQAPSILAALDHREKNGYARYVLPLFDDDGAAFAEGIVFVATESNPNFLGPAPLAEIAAQIASAVGPSGANVEYVVELARALRDLGDPDPHLDEIVAALGQNRGG
jgi:cation transport regulator ChaC